VIHAAILKRQSPAQEIVMVWMVVFPDGFPRVIHARFKADLVQDVPDVKDKNAE
jgi:hypothetical protein